MQNISRSRLVEIIFVTCALVVFTGSALWSIRGKSVTVDEYVFITAGYSYVKTFDYRLNPDHPPVAKLLVGAALLWHDPILPIWHPSWAKNDELAFSRQFLFDANNNGDVLVYVARSAMVTLGAILGLVIFLFARELYGFAAAALALWLFAFSPNILAHTRLATTDLSVTAFSFFCLYALWRYARNGSRRALTTAGLMLGLTMGSKFSAIYMIPIALLVIWWRVGVSMANRETSNSSLSRFKSTIRPATYLFTVALLTLAACYGFVHLDRMFRGISITMGHNSLGHPAYLMGLNSRDGWFAYFPVAIGVKTPVPFLTILLVTILFYPWINSNWLKALSRDAILLVPAATLLTAALFSRIDIGLRHILPLYPLLFVFASQLVLLPWKNSVKTIIVLGLASTFAISSLVTAPHYLSYFNVLAGGMANGPRWLLDSNVDWGQDLKGLAQFARDNNVDEFKLSYFGVEDCAYRKLRCRSLGCTPETGILAISVNHLYGIIPEYKQCYAWLRAHDPVTRIGGSIYIYKISY